MRLPLGELVPVEDLRPGDQIHGDPSVFPYSLYGGTVRSIDRHATEVVVLLTDGEYTRPIGHTLDVQR